MKVFTEKEAEDFLEKNGFEIIQGFFVKTEKKLKRVMGKVNVPFVMKISGKKIIHKNRVNGIRLNIKTYEQALKFFRELKKIKNFQGVLIQKQIKGEEFLIGIKKTPEFGHVVCFGAGGITTEKLNDVSFRVFPFNNEDIKEMIYETKISKKLNKKTFEKISEILIKLNSFIKK